MTDVCPITFGPNLRSLPNPLAIAAVYSSAPPVTNIAVEFDQAMDQTVTPDPNSFDVIVTGVSRGIASVAWIDSTHLNLVSDPGIAPGSPVVVSLPVSDPLLRCCFLSVVLPFTNLVADP